jgi:hypothetical protein
MGSPKKQKSPPPVDPPPPPVSSSGQDVAQAQKDQRHRERRRYSFDKTILAAANPSPAGTKSTLG